VEVTRPIYVGTSGGLVALSDPIEIDFESREVASIARGVDSWWAIVDRHELWCGRPGSWELAARIPSNRLTCVLSHGGGALVGTSEARLVQVDADGKESFLTGFDDALGREEWFTPWGGPPDVRSLAGTGTRMFVNVHVGGILRSDDGLNTFSPTIDIRSDVHQVIFEGGSLLAATARGLATSDDLGTTWSFHTAGLHATYCRAVQVAGDTILLTASVGPYGGRSAVYRSHLSGGDFEKCDRGLPEWFGDNIDTGCLFADESTAAFATGDGRVFESYDRGETWEERATDMRPARHIVAV
jgi:hypothetical protein